MNTIDNSTPKISVIIPAYNVEEYIGELLDCVLRQTMQDYEVIIVNDGSTDGTQKIIDQYRIKSPAIRSFEQINKGASAGRNYGVKKARGEFVAFVDADDLISEEYLQKLYIAISSENSDVAVCSFRHFDSATGKEVSVGDCRDNIATLDDSVYLFTYLPVARLIRKSFLYKHNIWFSEGEEIEDIAYFLAVNALAENTSLVDDVLYFARLHNDSTTGQQKQGKRMPVMCYSALEDAILKVRDSHISQEKRNLFEFAFFKAMAGFLTNAFRTYDPKIRKDICNYCYEIIPRYFVDYYKNPYLQPIKRNSIKMSLSHKIAVRLFVISLEKHSLESFSDISSFVLRFFNK